MPPTNPDDTAYLRRLADGTTKQRNPFSGTEVWTVPGRGNRPLGMVRPAPQPLDPSMDDATCAFCAARYLETPPEKARIVRGANGAYHQRAGLGAAQMMASRAEFRRVPNLFEILSFDYWHANYGYELPAAVARRRDAYLADPAGWDHVSTIVDSKLRAAGMSDADRVALSADDIIGHAAGFFGGGHDVIIARRHFIDGAQTDHDLAGAGTLSPDEHAQFVILSAHAAADLYQQNPHVRYVSVFQNWLKPAGASFDHLHKQVVAIDEIGRQNEAAADRVHKSPNAFNDDAVNYAAQQRLIIATNEHAVMFAGFGHRYPTIEIYSTSAEPLPWRQDPAELRGMSDLLHAAHAATGADVPSNEEWHTQPPGVIHPMPWRICLKWRVSTLAGFEGATKIYLNTISPKALRERVLVRLRELHDAGRLAPGIRLAEDGTCARNVLRYVRV